MPSPDGEALVVRPMRAKAMLNCSKAKLYELLRGGELRSFLDGRARKITVESIHDYIAKRLAACKRFERARHPERPTK